MATKQPPPDLCPPIPPFLRGDDKRTVILRAAHTLFLRDGFSTTSMDAVTRQAGVSKATVYAHFDSKQALFETLVREGVEGVFGMVPTLARGGGEPAGDLLAFFEPFLTMVFHGGYAWDRLVIAEAVRHPANARLFYACTIERVTAAVEGYLAGLHREKVVSVPDPRLAAETLVAVALLGPLHRVLLLGPEAVDFKASLRAGVASLLG